MKGSPWQLLGLGFVGWIVYKVLNQSSATGTLTEKVANVVDAVQNTFDPGSWAKSANALKYIPYILDTETQLGIPPYLLARIAYQESHFRDDIVNGTVKSPAGAVGLMQLMPQYFANAGRYWVDDVYTAGQLLVQLYNRFQDWQLAVAAYNDGQGNVNKYIRGVRQLPQETINYVTDVMADVPLQGSVINV